MSRIRKIVITIAVLIVCFYTLKQFAPIIKLDGYIGLLFSITLSENTKYSEGYSNEKFLKINVGMTKKEVINILGNPIVEFKPNDEIDALQYSESPNSTHYRLRQIHLINDKVMERISYFYVD